MFFCSRNDTIKSIPPCKASTEYKIGRGKQQTGLRVHGRASWGAAVLGPYMIVHAKHRGDREAILDGTADVEFAHAGLQSGALHAEDGGGAFGTGDAPFGLAQCTQDVLTLGFFESGHRGRQSGAWR